MTSTTDSRQARSSHTTEDPQPDADSSSTFWRSAPATFLEQSNMGEPLSGRATEVRSRWSSRHLYLLFTCPFDTLHIKSNPNTLTETNKLWEWDVAEVFLSSDFDNIRRYKEFEMSPQGEFVDIDVDLDSPRHEGGWTWSSGFNVAARIVRSRRIWYGSMKIPFSAIDLRSPRAGNLLRVNFFRSHGKGQNLIAWSPTMQPTFHVPEAFGTLLLLQ